MASVTGTIVATKLSSIGDGDTAQVGAHTQDDKPLWVLDTLRVRLGISQGGGVTRDLSLDLSGGPVPDKQGLASPLEGHVLA